MDLFSASRVVRRNNTLYGVGPVEVHATGHSGGDRGARSVESYRNTFSPLPGQATPPFTMEDVSSGTYLVWGNTSEANNLQQGLYFNVTRKGEQTYVGGTGSPADWGYCNGPRSTGTVTTVGTAVTRSTGTNFNVLWPAATPIRINGVNYAISSVADTNNLTLTATAGNQPVAVAYSLGSTYDGNTDYLGYPCIDQPGRGIGLLLVGDFPTKFLNGTSDPNWPSQALEPIYVWMNSFAAWNPCCGGSTYNDSVSGGRVVAGRDYYKQASSINTCVTPGTTCTPFDGTKVDTVVGTANSGGAGWGLIANRPDNCTLGTSYWATDEGEWDSSNGATADGKLYVCTATGTPGTWTARYGDNATGLPYTYPHPRVVSP
jgi:hypothetical protein